MPLKQHAPTFIVQFGVLAISLVHLSHADVNEMTPLVCLEDGIHEDECSRSVRRVTGAPSEYLWLKERSIIQVQGITQSKIVYTNVSIIYKNLSEITQLYIEPVGANANCTHWLVHPHVPQTVTFPLHVKLAFIPFDPIDVKRKSKSPYFPVESSCQSSESKNECLGLHNSVFVFKSLDSKTILLSLEGDVILEGLHVELLSAPCLLDCQLGISNCTDGTVNVTYQFWHRTSNNLIFKNRTPNYYCVRVSPRDRCCTRCSENELLETNVRLRRKYLKIIIFSFNRPLNAYWPRDRCCTRCSENELLETIGDFVEKYDSHVYSNLLRIWLWFSLAFALMWFVLWIIFRGNFKQSSYTATDEPSRLLRNAQETGQQINTDQDIAMIQRGPYVEILLLYPKETENFQTLMDAFRNLLKTYVSKVWDPNDEESIEVVSENWWQWLETVLKIPSLKVIVVETEKCKQWLSKNFQQNSIQTHYLEGIFLYALATVKEDHLLCRDYTRLFRIRFDSPAPSERINLIVPCTCYEMPQHLSNLIGDILGLRSFKLRSVNSKEKELFSEAMQEYGLKI